MSPQFFGETVDSSQERDQFARLPLIEKRTRCRFRAMVHPESWMWRDDLGCYVPNLGQMVISGGVNGTAIGPNGEEDDAPCRANWQRKGWRIIELGDTRFDAVTPRGNYQRRWKTKGNGWAYSYAWEHPNVVAGKVIWHSDDAKRDEFLRIIVAAGILSPMDPDLKRLKLQVAENRLRRLVERSNNNPDRKYQVETRLQMAERLHAALVEDLEATEAGRDPTLVWAGTIKPQPAPKRSRRKSAPQEVEGEEVTA